MKLKWFLVTVTWTFWLSLASGKRQSFVVPSAIKSIIEEHFSKITATFPGKVDVVLFGNKTGEFELFIIKLSKVQSLNVNIKFCHGDLNGIKTGKQFQMNSSSIVFFDSVEGFNASAPKIKWISHPRQRSQHLVHVPGLTILDIVNAFPDGFDIDQVNFLMNATKNSIKLVASFMFTDHACRVQQLKTINRFNSNTLKWANSIFYPKKYQNMHGCKLTIMERDEKRIGALMNLIFKTGLNAQLSPIQNISKIQDCKQCDFIQQEQFIAHNFSEVCIANQHDFEIFTFAVPPGEPYTDLERMFMMFSEDLWIAIGVTLLIGVLATLSLHFQSDKVRKFIAGRDIQSPTMNLISIFLNGGQVQTPGRNFARFIFIQFVMWSLIIRTCHQSMLFELMQADLRRQPIRTLDEFFASNLTLHELKGYENNSLITIDEYFIERMAKPETR